MKLNNCGDVLQPYLPHSLETKTKDFVVHLFNSKHKDCAKSDNINCGLTLNQQVYNTKGRKLLFFLTLSIVINQVIKSRCWVRWNMVELKSQLILSTCV